MSKAVVCAMVFATALLLVIGCGPRLDPPRDGELPTRGATVTSERSAATMRTDATEDEIGRLVSGNTAFALDLYHEVQDQGQNLVYSPLSLSVVLAMTYAGARGSTGEQMAEVLHFELEPGRLHPTFRRLLSDIGVSSAGAGDTDGQAFELSIADALWGQTGRPFVPEFLDLLSEGYGAGLEQVDFSGQPEVSRRTINEWVAERTAQRVPELVPEGMIDSSTELVLTDAVYFKAAWRHTFDSASTQEGPFHRLDGVTVKVPMMRAQATFGYARGDGYQILELPYVGDTAAMDILLPDQGRFEPIERSLDAEALQGMLAEVGYAEVALALPRFTFDTAYELSALLAGMGMPDAFDATRADFSGMDGTGGLFIGEVLHQAFVAVDEAGTEAAGASAVTMIRGGPVTPEVEVVVDRPFIFVIRDLGTGAILFVGRVIDPMGS